MTPRLLFIKFFILKLRLAKQMFFSFILTLLIAAVSRVVAENSPDFTLRVYAPDTKLDGFNLFLKDDGKLYISATADVTVAHIYENGTLILDGQVVGDGRNYLSTAAFSTAWKPASNWTITDGFLELYNKTYYHAIPSGNDGEYVLGTGNAVSSGNDITEIRIIPVSSSSYILQTWPIEIGVNAYGSSSVLYTQTTFAYMTVSSAASSTFATVSATSVSVAAASASAQSDVSNAAGHNTAGFLTGLFGIFIAMI